MMARFYLIVFCLLLGSSVFSTSFFWMKSNELEDTLKNTPPKTITEFVTKKALPCPSELVTFFIASPFGGFAIHVRPGDVDQMLKQKHKAIKEIERQRMEQQGSKPIPKAPISNNGTHKRMVENL